MQLKWFESERGQGVFAETFTALSNVLISANDCTLAMSSYQSWIYIQVLHDISRDSKSTAQTLNVQQVPADNSPPMVCDSLFDIWSD